VCVSILPQLPQFVLQIEGSLIPSPTSEDDNLKTRFVIGNRGIPYVNQRIIDEALLREVLKRLFPLFQGTITTEEILSPEHREMPILFGFRVPNGIPIDGLIQFRLNNCRPVEDFLSGEEINL
jgi:hypothetical protein